MGSKIKLARITIESNHNRTMIHGIVFHEDFIFLVLYFFILFASLSSFAIITIFSSEKSYGSGMGVFMASSHSLEMLFVAAVPSITEGAAEGGITIVQFSKLG
mmetsp:Transcript_13935/g.19080  ORF Transcript_13935/g.19080 Transcript_13935/m.19080 type:complete len:103 (-) Transcript_13935:142-450(-)